jgi:predicted transcriptional regulator
MKYKCKCGNVADISIHYFKMGRRCRKCCGSEKLNLDFVKKKFEEAGCELLADEYENCMALMPYKCNCGNISKVRWNDFKDGVRCGECRVERMVETRDENKSHWAYTGKYRPPENKVELVCEVCNKTFKFQASRKKTFRFCSIKCRAKWQETHTTPPTLTPEMKKKISETAKARGSHKGENNANWNPNREEARYNKIFSKRIRILVQNLFHLMNRKKTDFTNKILGYSFKQLRDHIVNHPNCENVKDKKWHLDHIFPIKAFFDYKVYDVKIINCLDNLQSLLAEENRYKHAKYDRQEFENWLISKNCQFYNKKL